MAPDVNSGDENTFEEWLNVKGLDPTTLTRDQLETWRRYFDKHEKNPTPKVGLMKLQPLIPGEYR
jgi:hypothetical protein